MSGLAEILDENRRLREALAARDSRVQELENEASKREAMLQVVQNRADVLERELAFLQHKAVRPASYRHVPDIQSLLPFPGDVVPPPRLPVPEATDDEDPAGGRHARRRGKPKRRSREDFAHMPSRRAAATASPEATCAGCGGALAVIGQAESFRIDSVPGHFEVLDIARDKCACPNCPDQGVLTVPAPAALPRSQAGNGLLARVMVDKFCDHIPLHRQVRRMAREGFETDSTTLSRWVCDASDLLSIVAHAVQRDLLAGAMLQGDDTGFPIQDGGDGRLRKGRLWAFTDQAQVMYAFTPTKQGEFPAQILDGFAGDLLLVDGGTEFNKVVRDQGLERGGCWSHLRNYFFDARQYHPVEAAVALGTIRDLFMIERQA